jgi:hypothetical protein
MSIAVLTSNGRVCPQCGKIVQLTLVDFDPAARTVRQTSSLTPPLMSAGAFAGGLPGRMFGGVVAEVMGGPVARGQRGFVAFCKP